MLTANILIADKDTKFVSMLKARFEKNDFSVYASADVQTVWEVLDNHWVDLVVLGTGVKGVKNNIEFLKKLRAKKNFKTLPVVINTNDKIQCKEQFKLLGVLNFFIRPFCIDLFIDEIKDILTKKILVFGDNESTIKKVASLLEKIGYQIDVTTQASAFFSHVSVKWYSLLVIEYSCGKNISDKMVSVVRTTLKNSLTPIIIFNGSANENIAKDVKKKMIFFKEWASKIGNCDFLQAPYSIKKIKSFLIQHVDFFS
ncbi:MAG: response regulator [Candidatus Omnitrophica bacterium]|nr:response regulator [Candidatus Omnitrophota bacterium]